MRERESEKRVSLLHGQLWWCWNDGALMYYHIKKYIPHGHPPWAPTLPASPKCYQRLWKKCTESKRTTQTMKLKLASEKKIIQGIMQDMFVVIVALGVKPCRRGSTSFPTGKAKHFPSSQPSTTTITVIIINTRTVLLLHYSFFYFYKIQPGNNFNQRNPRFTTWVE